jgi:hypothetical protein
LKEPVNYTSLSQNDVMKAPRKILIFVRDFSLDKNIGRCSPDNSKAGMAKPAGFINFKQASKVVL